MNRWTPVAAAPSRCLRRGKQGRLTATCGAAIPGVGVGVGEECAWAGEGRVAANKIRKEGSFTGKLPGLLSPRGLAPGSAWAAVGCWGGWVSAVLGAFCGGPVSSRCSGVGGRSAGSLPLQPAAHPTGRCPFRSRWTRLSGRRAGAVGNVRLLCRSAEKCKRAPSHSLTWLSPPRGLSHAVGDRRVWSRDPLPARARLEARLAPCARRPRPRSERALAARPRRRARRTLRAAASWRES